MNEMLLCFRDVLTAHESMPLDPNIGKDYSGTPYPFGMDPVCKRFAVHYTTTTNFGFCLTSLFIWLSIRCLVFISLL